MMITEEMKSTEHIMRTQAIDLLMQLCLTSSDYNLGATMIERCKPHLTNILPLNVAVGYGICKIHLGIM